MAFTKRIIQFGDSLGLVIPKEEVEANKLKIGDLVKVKIYKLK